MWASIEQRGDKGKSNNDRKKDHPDHEDSLLGALTLRRSAGATVVAHGCAPDLAPSHKQGEPGYSEKDWLVLLESRELADPSARHTNQDKDKRGNAAERGQQSSQDGCPEHR
jgi:hypothetical protein